MLPDNLTLCLPEEYKSNDFRRVLSCALDLGAADIFATAHDIAAHFMRRGGHQYVINIGLQHYADLRRLVADPQVIGVDTEAVLRNIDDDTHDMQLVEVDFQKTFELPSRWVQNAIIVCHGVLETLEDPLPLLGSLKMLSESAPVVILVVTDRERSSGVSNAGPPRTPNVVREWTLGEWTRLARKQGIEVGYSGYIDGFDRPRQRSSAAVLCGRYFTPQNVTKVRVCAIIACYNEADIVAACFRHLDKQGVDVCFIDDWSTDGTWEIIESIRHEHPDRCVHIERFGPDGPSVNYDCRGILRRKQELAQTLAYDWYIHQDTDEMRYAPNANETLIDAISKADQLGFNAIDHTVLDFRPTDDQYMAGQVLSDHFHYFEFDGEILSLGQVKTFKRQSVHVDLATSGGHQVAFAGRRVYPLNFQSSHYAFRTTRQARTKLFRDRLPRISRERDELGWHTHFERFAALPSQPDYIWSPSNLLRFNQPYFDAQYLVERLTGLGLRS